MRYLNLPECRNCEGGALPAVAIQHKAGHGCWCKEKHTAGEAMRLNARDIPKATNAPKFGAKKKKGKKNPKGHY